VSAAERREAEPKDTVATQAGRVFAVVVIACLCVLAVAATAAGCVALWNGIT
jgi:hypothetical protein